MAGESAAANPAAPSPATWEERYRAPRTGWVRIAARRPERGLICTNSSGVYQVHRWIVGEPPGKALTRSPVGRTNAWISPDGEWVVWHADEAGNEVGHFVAMPWSGGEAVDLTPELPPYASFAADFGDDGTFVASIIGHDRVQIAVIAMPGAERTATPASLLDPGPGFVVGVARHGTRVAYTTTGGRGLSTGLRIVDAASGQALLEIDHAPGAISLHGYGPSGTVLASTSRTGTSRPLVVEADGTVTEFALPDIEDELFPLSLSRDGATALLLGGHRSIERLYLLELRTGVAHRLDGVSGSVAPSRPGASTFIAPDGRVIVTREDATTTPEVVVVDPVDGRTIETLVPASDVPPSRPLRSLEIPTTDGATVQGWLATPEGPGPFPTILDVHGGPQANESDRFNPDAQAWVDRGFAFLALNYRGSTGFGRAYEQAIWGRPGRCELDDMVAARELLVREGIADPDRVVPFGGSYGGYLTLLALGRRPDLWAAGVAIVAIADWRLLYEDGESLRDYQRALFEGTPDEKPEEHAEASPVTYVGDLRAPVLIIQGRNDARCPARQMEDYVARARRLGKALEIDWFDAGHGHGAIDTRVAWCRRWIEFVERSLGIEAASPV
jgi:dipeptidyl aminopeptidase/acylaminoacyl peptidase